MKSYRNTVRLPQTEFPMRANLTSREPLLLQKWEKERLYQKIQEVRQKAPTYILHDGPPFANGHVHMGTALNKCLKDFIIKSKTMAGFRAPYIPGWDCHGLPIEFKVVKSAQGLSPLEIRQRSEEYARSFIAIQKEEFTRLGVFGDWEHPYLTLDPAYEATIIRSFGKMVTQERIYRKKKPVYWSTVARTALAEAEVEYREKISPAAYVAFPIKETAPELQEALIETAAVIWTTTPWTLPSNAAIAFHPEITYQVIVTKNSATQTKRYLVAEALQEKFLTANDLTLEKVVASFPGKALTGTVAKHPFLDRSSPLLPADFVTIETGTGLVHIAPGHGDDDYHLGNLHQLPILSPIDDGGRFTEEAGLPEIIGKTTAEANPIILALLEKSEKLLSHADYHHSYPHCWRSKTPIIFRAVEQFFIAIDPLRQQALQELKKIQWIPSWGYSRMKSTIENRPDWCISRQRYWGVPLPAFYDSQGTPILDPEIIERVATIIEHEGGNAWFALDDATWCERVGLPAGSTRRNDTLDVWIESGISHEAVLRQRPELSFPADIYLEATDQHRGWFQSSLMTAVALHGNTPYKTLFTHGFVVDSDTRQKISKSNQGEGGYQKPTEANHFMNHYGADIVRLWASSIQATDEVPFSEEIFARLTDAYRRIRNTLRILLGNIGTNGQRPPEDLAKQLPTHSIDAWILARLEEVTASCRKAYEEFAFQKVYQLLTNFCTVDLSSNYIDVTKDRLYCDPENSLRRQQTEQTMAALFEGLVRLLAPILAFTAEEAWGHYRDTLKAPETVASSVHLELFPQEKKPNQELLDYYKALLELRSRITQQLETAQQAGIISKPLEASVTITTNDPLILSQCSSQESKKNFETQLEELYILSHLEIVPTQEEREKISVTLYDASKCERCWRHRPEVGENKEHPTLCTRCLEAVTQQQ